MAKNTNDTTDPTSAPPLPGRGAKSRVSAKATAANNVQQNGATEPDIKPANLDTPESDAAIADIVAHEADEVLAAQDAGIEAAQASVDDMPEEPKKHGHPIFWFFIVLLVAISVIAFVILTNPGLELPFAA